MYYTITRDGRSFRVSTLLNTNNVRSGDKVAATFKVRPGCTGTPFIFASYLSDKPLPPYQGATQLLVDIDSERYTYGGKTYTLKIDVPGCSDKDRDKDDRDWKSSHKDNKSWDKDWDKDWDKQWDWDWKWCKKVHFQIDLVTLKSVPWFVRPDPSFSFGPYFIDGQLG